MDDNWRLNLQEERKALLIRKEILTLEDNSYIGELEEIQGLEEAPKVFIDEKTSLRRKEIKEEVKTINKRISEINRELA